MRIINADDLKDLMYIACMGQDKAFVKVFEQVIDDCPTIDPESLIPHGRWENIPLNMDQSYFAYRWNLRKRCSVCEYAMPQEWPDFSICPNCGAKMKKEG